MFKEFRDFAMKGNVFYLAVGVIIGGAFGKIVTSLVNDIIMPIFVLILGHIKLNDMEKYGIRYGQFLQSVIDFLIVSFSIFMFIKILSRFKKKEEKEEKEEKLEEKPEKSKEEILLSEIRDLLRENLK